MRWLCVVLALRKYTLKYEGEKWQMVQQNKERRAR